MDVDVHLVLSLRTGGAVSKPVGGFLGSDNVVLALRKLTAKNAENTREDGRDPEHAVAGFSVHLAKLYGHAGAGV